MIHSIRTIHGCMLGMLFVLASCTTEQPDTPERDRGVPLPEQVQRQAEEIKDMQVVFAEIRAVLDLIDARERFMQGQVDLDESPQLLRDRVLYNVRLVNGLMAETRMKLDNATIQLRDHAQARAQDLRALEECKARLQQSETRLEQALQELADQGLDRSALQEQLSAAELAIAKQEALIEARERDLGRVWYAVGTERQLRDRGVISRSGGWHLLGKKNRLNRSSDGQAFTEADQRSIRRIDLGCKRANLLTEHPEGSFAFVTEGDKLAYLSIADPNEFWRFTRYLIVETK